MYKRVYQFYHFIKKKFENFWSINNRINQIYYIKPYIRTLFPPTIKFLKHKKGGHSYIINDVHRKQLDHRMVKTEPCLDLHVSLLIQVIKFAIKIPLLMLPSKLKSVTASVWLCKTFLENLEILCLSWYVSY